MWKLLSLVLGSPLGRALDSVDKYFDNETEKEKSKDNLKAKWLEAQASNFNGKSWKVFSTLMVLFALPIWFWFTAVLVYSVFWCSKCAYPQPWVIAALPPPLDQWAGGIIMTLFGGMSALGIFSKK